MTSLAEAKAVVLAQQESLDAAPAGDSAAALAAHLDATAPVRVSRPWEDGSGPGALARPWDALKTALGPLQRRPDIFFAGANAVCDTAETWVVSSGHMLGLFDAPLWGMRPTRRAVMLRYVTFDRVEGARIIESTTFFDALNLMRQAGAEALPAATAAVMVTPGPRTHDGLLLRDAPAAEGAATLALFQRMIARLVAAGARTRAEDLVLDWTDDMIWWGPGGIGAPYTAGRYLEQHCRPFEDGLDFGAFHGHRLETAEGAYGGFFGWPTFDVRSRGGYLGLCPASDRWVGMRVLDLYRRAGDRLAENWNIIDELHLLEALGIDLLARQGQLTGL